MNTEKYLTLYELWHKASLGIISDEELVNGRKLELEFNIDPKIDIFIERAKFCSAEIEQKVKNAVDSFQKGIQQISKLCCEAIVCHGEEAKQWYLEQIAESLGIDLPPHKSGIPQNF